MTQTDEFLHSLTAAERKAIRGLTSPPAIQAFVDGFTYSSDHFYRCPLRSLRDGLAHCFDGALFAAAALRLIGLPPLLLEMLPNDRDDDHILAVFKTDGHWGAIAKSNFVGLRYREPIHRTLRELVISYFEAYYNVAREKTLRGYTLPINLTALDRHAWMTRDDGLDEVANALDRARKFPLITAKMAKRLCPVDPRTYESGLQGSVATGLFQPDEPS
ncbi:MAG: hypothetical protein GX442_12355 [Candidatus Riflebacteria bacterium]|nr:hypothetical protein [Candidatus Riflebacteria bacterium]